MVGDESHKKSFFLQKSLTFSVLEIRAFLCNVGHWAGSALCLRARMIVSFRGLLAVIKNAASIPRREDTYQPQ